MRGIPLSVPRFASPLESYLTLPLFMKLLSERELNSNHPSSVPSLVKTDQ